MNDDQKRKLLTSLGNAFDKAATRAHHKTEAAMQIIAALRLDGFVIRMERQSGENK